MKREPPMTRDDFLRELRIALQGRISQTEVNRHLAYYETFIIEESRKGRTEREVIESLGSPRLIAKTIIQYPGNGTDTYEEEAKQPGRQSTRVKKLLLVFLIFMVLVLFVRIGLFLLPVLMAVYMIGAILRVVYRIFYKNKK